MPDIPAPATTAGRALLASAVRHALTAIGSMLVTRGIVDQGAVDGFMATAVEMIVGSIIVAGATGWGQLRAFISHTRWASALAAAEASNPLPSAAAGQAGSADPAA